MADNWFDEVSSQVVAFRERIEGYAGLLGRFQELQTKMKIDFDSSAAIKHPGDKGSSREDILRQFLTGHGHLPGRYGVSRGSTHVVSTSGHLSAQIDLLLYDAFNAPRLLSVGDIEYFPIESCHGAIEVKSNLSGKGVVDDALDKVASFKRLRIRSRDGLSMSSSFGILFAYECSLSRDALRASIENWQKRNPSTVWPNLIVILSHGVLGHMGDQGLHLHNRELLTAVAPGVSPISGGKDMLLTFYLLLMELLGSTHLPDPPLRHYVLLPLKSGSHSYYFEFGAFQEAGYCEDHGKFLQRVTQESVEKIIHTSAPDLRDAAEMMKVAYGAPDGFSGDWGKARLYNPDDLPLQEILVRRDHAVIQGVAIQESLDYVPIIIDGEKYWLPNYYVFRDGLISGCPKCSRPDLSSLTIEMWHQLTDETARRKATDGM